MAAALLETYLVVATHYDGGSDRSIAQDYEHMSHTDEW
jgi:hypothetical protein